MCMMGIDSSQAKRGTCYRGKRYTKKGAGASQLWYPCKRFKQMADITRNKKLKMGTPPPHRQFER
jgi:hypothetical protein